MAVRYRATIETPDGTRTCFEAARHRGNRKPQVARFGGIPLSRRKTAILHDRVPGRNPLPRKEIITRLQRSTCELCGIRGEVHVHHVAKLSELAKTGLHQPEWAELMATRRRKDPRRLPALPRPYPHRPGPGHTPHNIGHRRAGCRESWHVRFGGRPCGKGPATSGTSPHGLPNRRP
ncbi:hypothetical protein [Nocardia vinacea]|uniref:HNH endonuclease n=1 Tax=Nocardia vinacea TaxID=96468 RepID=UPI003AF234E0